MKNEIVEMSILDDEVNSRFFRPFSSAIANVALWDTRSFALHIGLLMLNKIFIILQVSYK